MEDQYLFFLILFCDAVLIEFYKYPKKCYDDFHLFCSSLFALVKKNILSLVKSMIYGHEVKWMQLKTGVTDPMHLGATSTKNCGKNSIVSSGSRWQLVLFRCGQITYITGRGGRLQIDIKSMLWRRHHLTDPLTACAGWYLASLYSTAEFVAQLLASLPQMLL